MTRLLGIDLGERRIGLALAEVGAMDATPARALTTIRRGSSLEADEAALRAVIDLDGVDQLVVGLPLDSSGSDGPQAILTRRWADAMEARLGLPVTFRDERLTSHLAEIRLGPMKRGRSGGPPSKTQRDAYRARVDREAAAIILEDELDARARSRAEAGR